MGLQVIGQIGLYSAGVGSYTETLYVVPSDKKLYIKSLAYTLGTAPPAGWTVYFNVGATSMPIEYPSSQIQWAQSFPIPIIAPGGVTVSFVFGGVTAGIAVHADVIGFLE